MFEFERHTVKDLSTRIVASVRAERSLEARQRDIYDSHRHRTFSLAYYMTGNEIEAERILTQTFVRAFESAPEPTGQEVDLALLTELRKRVSLDLDIPLYTSLLETGTQFSRQVGRNVRRTDLEEGLAELPPMERLLFLLRDVEGYAPAAIAELLRMPESYVNRGVCTARIRLRRLLVSRKAVNSAVA